MGAYSVVEQFENRVAERFRMRHAVAVDCCTNGLFLSLKYRQSLDGQSLGYVNLPCRTYISVPFACMDAGLRIQWRDTPWDGSYNLEPWGVVDAAKLWNLTPALANLMPRLRSLWCLSFHIKKPIPIGRGGMILTNDSVAATWLRRARYDGRSGVPFDQENIKTRGWHMYMTPEQAARGMSLVDIYPDGVTIPDETYPDLSRMDVFRASTPLRGGA